MSLIQQKKSRRSMIFLITIFGVPVILAKLALTFHWFDYGVTNKGVLVENSLTLEKLGLSDELSGKNWYILYANINACEQHCEKVIESVMLTYTALGREMPRVSPVFITSSPLSELEPKLKPQAKLKLLQWDNMSQKTKDYFTASQVLIVDPLGNVVLSHTPPESLKQLPFFGKEILVDMKKLLKYSRVG